MKKLTTTERATKAGKARWAKISSKERSKYSSANGKKLWEKIRSGGLASKLDK
jgi:hypothetical protein